MNQIKHEFSDSIDTTVPGAGGRSRAVPMRNGTCCGPRNHRPTFNLIAQQAYLTQPDGQAIYSWGYGCNCCADRVCSGRNHRYILQFDASSRSHDDRN